MSPSRGNDRRRPRNLEDNIGKILVVDDDQEIVSTVRAVLENKGYCVFFANDGNAGLHIAERENPELLIIDMMMPKKSGFIVVERLKKTEECPPIIMITANEGSRHRAYAELLGVDTYIRKPFAMEKLIEEVETLLEQSRAKRNNEGSAGDSIADESGDFGKFEEDEDE